jgi:transcriptional regulator with XRE-family HTH domain
MMRTGKPKPGVPFADSVIAKYLTKQINALSGVKNQREIAAEIGYDKPNMISMVKRGEARVPLEKIPALAKSIEADPAFLFRLALQQYWPDRLDAVAAVFGTVVTKKEAEILARIRQLSNDSDPELTRELEHALMEAFDKTT